MNHEEEGGRMVNKILDNFGSHKTKLLDAMGRLRETSDVAEIGCAMRMPHCVSTPSQGLPSGALFMSRR